MMPNTGRTSIDYKIKSVYTFLIFMCLLFNSCQGPVKTNVLQTSFDVEQSKANGVFVAEYETSQNELEFYNQSYYIQQVWMEYYWVYKDQRRNIEMDKSMRGLIKFKNDSNLLELNFIRDSIISGGYSHGKLFFHIPEIRDSLSFEFYLDNDTIPIKMYKKSLR